MTSCGIGGMWNVDRIERDVVELDVDYFVVLPSEGDWVESRVGEL